MNKIWIIGAGIIAQEYAKVLETLGREYIVIGRGEEKAKAFETALNHEVVVGGLEQYLSAQPQLPEAVIVATNLGSLAATCKKLMQYGVRKIFSEKPGFLYPQECKEVASMADTTKTSLFLAYNRRFFASTLAAEQVIAEDGGIKSFNFEFTEWGHVIEKLNKPAADLENWFFANSTHVVDLAFFLGGIPTKWNAHTADELSWHKPAVFAGSGITDKNALFCYQANWAAPGRWGVELLTAQHRLYLRPMEQLQIQNIGSVAINSVEIDDSLDKQFKPGFYRETEAFLNGDWKRLCSIQEQRDHVANIYMKMVGK